MWVWGGWGGSVSQNPGGRAGGGGGYLTPSPSITEERPDAVSFCCC